MGIYRSGGSLLRLDGNLLILTLVLFAIVAIAGCAQPSSVPPTPDIEATVQVRVQSTVQAFQSALPTATVEPVRTPTQTTTATPTREPTPSPQPSPTVSPPTVRPTRTLTPTRTPRPEVTPRPTSTSIPTATPAPIPTPDTRVEAYVEQKLALDKKDARFRRTMLALEFPPQGIVTIEWAEEVETLQNKFASQIKAWEAVEPAPGFESHHPMLLKFKNEELRVANAMRDWIGVGANPQARQERIDAYQMALDNMERLRKQAVSEFDRVFDSVVSNTPPDLLEGPVEADTGLESAGISSTVTLVEDSRWQFSWKTEVFSGIQQTVEVAIRVKWLDKAGFPVAEDVEIALRLRPGERKQFSGIEVIPLPAAASVESVSATVGITARLDM